MVHLPTGCENKAKALFQGSCSHLEVFASLWELTDTTDSRCCWGRVKGIFGFSKLRGRLNGTINMWRCKARTRNWAFTDNIPPSGHEHFGLLHRLTANDLRSSWRRVGSKAASPVGDGTSPVCVGQTVFGRGNVCGSSAALATSEKQGNKQTNQQRKRGPASGPWTPSSPGVSTLLLTVRLTCPLRAAACIKSITYLCGFPATTFLSTEMSSSPGRSRPSRSAGVFSIMAPITICSKTINISGASRR